MIQVTDTEVGCQECGRTGKGFIISIVKEDGIVKTNLFLCDTCVSVLNDHLFFTWLKRESSR